MTQQLNRRDFLKSAITGTIALAIPLSLPTMGRPKEICQRTLYLYGEQNGYRVFIPTEFDALHVGDMVLECRTYGNYAESSSWRVMSPIAACGPIGNSYCEVMPL